MNLATTNSRGDWAARMSLWTYTSGTLNVVPSSNPCLLAVLRCLAARHGLVLEVKSRSD